MLSERECQQFRPLGNRLLVKRLSLPEQSQGDIYVLGRDYPTLGRVVRTGNAYARGALGEISPGNEIQWSIKPDFDQRCIIGPDWLCLETDDINLRIDDRGIARAVGNRVLLSVAKNESFLFAGASPLIIGQFHITKWSIGQVLSAGWLAQKTLNNLDVVLYNPSMRSELRLNNQRLFIVRDEDCIAVVEE